MAREAEDEFPGRLVRGTGARAEKRHGNEVPQRDVRHFYSKIA